MKINPILIKKVEEGIMAIEHTQKPEDLPKLQFLLSAVFPDATYVDKVEGVDKYYFKSGNTVFIFMSDMRDYPSGMESRPLADFFEPAITGNANSENPKITWYINDCGNVVGTYGRVTGRIEAGNYFETKEAAQATKYFIAHCLANRAKIELMKDIEEYCKMHDLSLYRLVDTLLCIYTGVEKDGGKEYLSTPVEQAYTKFADQLSILTT
jgi:hypothetical protein